VSLRLAAVAAELKMGPAQDAMAAPVAVALIQVAQAVAPHQDKGLLAVPARPRAVMVLAAAVHRLSVSARMLGRTRARVATALRRLLPALRLHALAAVVAAA